MRNCERWQEDDKAPDRLADYLVLAAFVGLPVVSTLLGMAIYHLLWN